MTLVISTQQLSSEKNEKLVFWSLKVNFPSIRKNLTKCEEVSKAVGKTCIHICCIKGSVFPLRCK